MKVIKTLFTGYLALLIFSLGGLLLVSPYLAFWHPDTARLATFQLLLRRAAELQILIGAAVMLLFGFLCVGPIKTLVFFAISLLVSFLVRIWFTSSTPPPGIAPSSALAGGSESGLAISFILLSWFSMSFTSYLLACKLVVRLGLRRQTLWSLLLGTYFLIAWSIAFDAAITGIHLPAQISIWDEYSASFGLPIYNALTWVIAGLLLLGMSRLFWRGGLDTQNLIVWLPFGMYTANISFVLLLSFGSGLWFPFLLSTCLVLFPESLVYFPREEPRPVHGGPLRASLSQLIWLVMRVGTWSTSKRLLRLNVEGVENIPRRGPVVIAARHFHYFFDGYILVRTVPRRLHTVVALDWLQAQSLRLIIELACSWADWPVVLRSEQLRAHDPARRWAYQQVEERQYLRRVIAATVRLLRSSEALAIFPEAYPNIDPHDSLKTGLDDFLPFRPGFLKLIELAERDRQTRVAIIPAGLIYTGQRGRRWQATVRYGQALFLDEFASQEEALRTVEEHVQMLSSPSSSASSTASLPSPDEPPPS